MPFNSKVLEYQPPSYSIQQGDELKVIKFKGSYDLYGIIVGVEHGRHKKNFPLCDLESIDLGNEGKQALDDYRYWFANRR